MKLSYCPEIEYRPHQEWFCEPLLWTTPFLGSWAGNGQHLSVQYWTRELASLCAYPKIWRFGPSKERVMFSQNLEEIDLQIEDWTPANLVNLSTFQMKNRASVQLHPWPTGAIKLALCPWSFLLVTGNMLFYLKLGLRKLQRGVALPRPYGFISTVNIWMKVLQSCHKTRSRNGDAAAALLGCWLDWHQI